MSADSPLEDSISHALASSPYPVHRKLRFEMGDGRVVLLGKVSSFYQKQMAQELVRSVRGVGEIENQLEVSW